VCLWKFYPSVPLQKGFSFWLLSWWIKTLNNLLSQLYHWALFCSQHFCLQRWLFRYSTGLYTTVQRHQKRPNVGADPQLGLAKPKSVQCKSKSMFHKSRIHSDKRAKEWKINLFYNWHPRHPATNSAVLYMSTAFDKSTR